MSQSINLCGIFHIMRRQAHSRKKAASFLTAFLQKTYSFKFLPPRSFAPLQPLPPLPLSRPGDRTLSE